MPEPEPALARHQDDRLFTTAFVAMCGFSFVVFLSAFQLFPTAPFRIIDLGGTKATAGLFLGFLTYASALSAPLTGALADRVGARFTLIVCSSALTLLAGAYGLRASAGAMLGLAFVHGVFWSGLLSASGAYALALMPPSRRAEGLSYWGLAPTLAIAVAPTVGLAIYRYGWLALCASVGALNLAMAVIAWRLPPDVRDASGEHVTGARHRWRDAVEWRVTVAAITLFLCAFGYGGVTSFVALFTESRGISPRGLFFTVFAATIILTRPFVGRLADRIGAVRILVPCLVLASAGYALIALGGGRAWLVLSAVVFGAGFGSTYSVFLAYVMTHVDASRRAAAFGGVLAAVDTGIGSGSMSLGWLIDRAGFSTAYGVASVVAMASIPYALFVAPRVLRRAGAAHARDR